MHFNWLASSAILLWLAVLSCGASAMPSGCYCGSYMFIIEGKACFGSPGQLALDLSIAGSKTSCPVVKYELMHGTALTFPNIGAADDCLGKLERDNSVSLEVTYNEEGNVIQLDAGVASVYLKSC